MDGRKRRDMDFGEKQSGFCKKRLNAHSPMPKTTVDSPSSTLGELNLTNLACSSSSVPKSLLADFFECPICLDYALPPIYQCKAGHLICSICRPKCIVSAMNDDEDCTIALCPTCRQPLDEIRNMALERMSNLISFPCKFATFGCLSKMPPTEKVAHEKECHFKIINCPVPKNSSSCEWQGGINDVKPHIIKCHKEVTILHGSDIVFLAADISTSSPVDWIMMQEAVNETFFVVLKKKKHENHTFYQAFSVLLGPQAEAKKFAYRLTLNDQNKRLTWEAVPKSIYEERKLWKTDCLKFDHETATMFAKQNDLAINVLISTKCEYTSSQSDSEESEQEFAFSVATPPPPQPYRPSSSYD